MQRRRELMANSAPQDNNIFDSNLFWNEGTSIKPDSEGFQYYAFPVENGTYNISTDVINNTASNVASVMTSDRYIAPTSGNNGVFDERPRTLTTNTGYIYIYIRNRSARGYLIWTKETFAPYYVKIQSADN